MTLTLTKQEKTWGWLLPVCQFLIFPVTVSMGCSAMGVYSMAAANVICFFLCAALAAVCFRDALLESFRRFRAHPEKTLRNALVGFALYWAVNLAVTALTKMIEPDFGNVNDASILAMLAESPLMMGLAVIFAAPLAEECIFRGWLFTGLAQRSAALAYAVSCGLFSAAHVVGYIGLYEPRTLVLCFVQYLGPSFVLCRTCQKDDSLCAPLLLHMAINAMSCIILG